MEYLFGLAVLFGLYLIWDGIKQVYENISLLNANYINNSRVILQDIDRIKNDVDEIKQDRQAE